MANEASIIELSGMNPINFTVADASNISKGALLKLSGDYTVVTSGAADNAPYAGIAAADKEASDGATTIAVHVPGQGNIFDIKNASGTITNGGIVSLSGTNLIKQAVEAETVTGAVVGKALESASASEVVRVIS